MVVFSWDDPTLLLASIIFLLYYSWDRNSPWGPKRLHNLTCMTLSNSSLKETTSFCTLTRLFPTLAQASSLEITLEISSTALTLFDISIGLSSSIGLSFKKWMNFKENWKSIMLISLEFVIFYPHSTLMNLRSCMKVTCSQLRFISSMISYHTNCLASRRDMFPFSSIISYVATCRVLVTCSTFVTEACNCFSF